MFELNAAGQNVFALVSTAIDAMLAQGFSEAQTAAALPAAIAHAVQFLAEKAAA
jgi:hypothetical protein